MVAASPARLVMRDEDGNNLATLVWRFNEPMACVSTAAVGGGFSQPEWVVNAQVPHGYQRLDLDVHAQQIASTVGVAGPGVAMFTAVDVRRRELTLVDDVLVTATVGVSDPVWAADTNAAAAAPVAGTVNVVVQLPVAHSPSALVNLIATVTEAKCQAFADWPVPGTGTPSDAVTVISPVSDGVSEPFGGPRSRFGRPTAKAAYDAITAGLRLGYVPAC